MHRLLIAMALLAACKKKVDDEHGAPEPLPVPERAAEKEPSPPSNELEPFATEESMHRLDRAEAKTDFFRLANQYEGQEHGGLCGPTSAVIVLNAMRVDAPPADAPVDKSAVPAQFAANIPPQYDPYFHRYTQRTFFADPRVTAVKSEATFYGTPSADGKRDPGMQLRQLHEILRALGAESTIRVLDDTVSDDTARAEIAGNLAHEGDYVIVNYDRKVLGQKGGGHISPLGAYDKASDSFLVLDVNPNQGKTWAWVPARMLFAAMRTHDTVENRGYLLVRDPPPAEQPAAAKP
jgi:hypothetical protein